jgi:hypothetical protein
MLDSVIGAISEHPLQGVLKESTRRALGKHLVASLLEVGGLDIGDLELSASLLLENL